MLGKKVAVGKSQAQWETSFWGFNYFMAAMGAHIHKHQQQPCRTQRWS